MYYPDGGSAGKEFDCNMGDLDSIPGLGRSPGEGKGSPLQYSGLENSVNCIVHGSQRVRHDRVTLTFTTQKMRCPKQRWLAVDMGPAIQWRLLQAWSLNNQSVLKKKKKRINWSLRGRVFAFKTCYFASHPKNLSPSKHTAEEQGHSSAKLGFH